MGSILIQTTTCMHAYTNGHQNGSINSIRCQSTFCFYETGSLTESGTHWQESSKDAPVWTRPSARVAGIVHHAPTHWNTSSSPCLHGKHFPLETVSIAFMCVISSLTIFIAIFYIKHGVFIYIYIYSATLISVFVLVFKKINI